MNSPASRSLPFHPFILLGLAPAMALVYLAIDNGLFFDESLARGQTVGRDFAIFWSASLLLWRGEIATLFDPAAFQPALERIMGISSTFLMPFPYPPHSMIFFAPLALFTYPVALVVWLAGTFSLFMAMLWRRLGGSWMICIGLLLSPASVVNISTGQNGFLSAALLCSGLLMLERRPITAGILLGLLSYKPQLGILIPPLLMVAGHWRAFGSATVTVLAMLLGSVALLGIDPWLLYVNKSGAHHLQFIQYGIGFFQQMSPTYFMAGRLLGFPLALAWTLQAFISLAALSGALWTFRQRVPHDLKCAVAMVAVFLVSPYVLTYDLTIVTVAILVASQCFVANSFERGIFAIAWLLPVWAFPPELPAGPFILTVLFVILLRRVATMAPRSAVISS